MRSRICGSLLLIFSAGCQAGLFKSYDWSDWRERERIEAYGYEWMIEERVQGVSYSPWHPSRWLIWQNYSGYSGTETHLVNNRIGFNENVLDLIFFPQKDGRYKSLLKKPFLDNKGRIDYYGSYGVYEVNGALWVWLEPDSETGADYLMPPYTDCGFLSAKEKVVYATDRRHEPEVYYGEFDPDTRKFYIRYTSAPIQYVYWSEWGGLTSPFLENRNYYRKPSVWDTDKKRYVPGALEVRPEYVFLGSVVDKARIPLICNEDDFKNAKDRFQSYVRDIWQLAIDKELGRMSEHERATLKREDCDGIGLNYDFGCKQIDNYGRNDGRKNLLPKEIRPARVENGPD